MTRNITKVSLESLTNVHAARNTERVQNNVYRGSIGEVGHVLGRENLGDNSLVSVAPGELVALANFTLLCNIDTHECIYTRCKFVSVVT